MTNKDAAQRRAIARTLAQCLFFAVATGSAQITQNIELKVDVRTVLNNYEHWLSYANSYTTGASKKSRKLASAVNNQEAQNNRRRQKRTNRTPLKG